MKLTIFAVALLGLALGALAGDKPAAKKAQPAPVQARAITIPEGAVEIEPYIYRYTDPKGKIWIYRKTPFGVMRLEDQLSPDAARKAQDDKQRLIDMTTAAEDGDSIRFERAWPFGRTQWQRKKTGLNEVERAVWNRELQKREARENATKD